MNSTISCRSDRICIGFYGTISHSVARIPRFSSYAFAITHAKSCLMGRDVFIVAFWWQSSPRIRKRKFPSKRAPVRSHTQVQRTRRCPSKASRTLLYGSDRRRPPYVSTIDFYFVNNQDPALSQQTKSSPDQLSITHPVCAIRDDGSIQCTNKLIS